MQVATDSPSIMGFLTLKPVPAESAGTAGESESAGTAGELAAPPTKSKATNNSTSALSASAVCHGYTSTEWVLSYTHSTRLMKPTSNNSSSESLQWLLDPAHTGDADVDRTIAKHKMKASPYTLYPVKLPPEPVWFTI